jgi:hypothetical protein
MNINLAQAGDSTSQCTAALKPPSTGFAVPQRMKLEPANLIRQLAGSPTPHR